ncbi:cytochrome oxidase putative small subunit CydP [Uliginosibacterium gangwonense]|uniref:cytochrome oxidase putative small subunit CydP n=1 Tax=Uliginosibacterium gangwonense TaxID=392736 RepID=UPI000367EB1C|nr:cytochrome oxidase putative small subunit CydP [Uliginosibacterium gangwonense]
MQPSSPSLPLPQQGKRRPNLKREIVLVLLLKLALIMIIKQVFFSHPLSKADAAAHLQAMIDAPVAAASQPNSSITSSNRE